MKFRSRFTLFLAACLLVGTPLAAIVQTTGTIDGTISDQNGSFETEIL